MSDKKIAEFDGGGNFIGYKADIISATDYYPFGMEMSGRAFSSNTSRYGFNGQEKDDEIKGSSGSSYDFGQRIYDPRLGKFLSIDPLTKSYPELTPYQFASNRPIDGIDLDGLEHVKYYFANTPSGAKYSSKITLSKVGPKGYGIEVNLVDSKGDVITTFIPTNARPTASKSSTSSSFVITGGLQGGINADIKGIGAGIEASVGNIDLIGFRDGNFVFMENPKRGIEGTYGLGKLKIEQEFISTPLAGTNDPDSDDFGKTLETRITRYTGGLLTTQNGIEIIEQGIKESLSQKSVDYRVVSKKNYSVSGGSFSVSLGVGLEISKTKEQRSESKKVE